MLNSKKAKILFAVSALALSTFAVCPIFSVNATTINGHEALQVSDAAAGVKISMWYDETTDEYVSSKGSRVKASAWKDAQVARNNISIEDEAKTFLQDIDNQKTTRENADAELNEKADLLSGEQFVRYDDTDKSSISLNGENGTVVDHVANGSMVKDSTDAMNVDQVNAVKDYLDDEAQARKDALADEKQNRDAADDEISKKIGFSDEITSSTYISPDETVSDNLLALDKALYGQSGQIDALNKDSEKRISQEAKNRDRADQLLDERIGSIGPNTQVDYIDADSSFSDNLVQLDHATKDLEDDYNAAENAFAQLSAQVKADRENADKQIQNRIGTISPSDNITYIAADASVSDNLLALDKATKDNADAIEKEINDRKNALADFSDQINASLADLSKENTNVGAGAAALAGLSYLPYETDQRLNVAAAVGHYGSKNAAAVGAKYNINEDMSLNLATTVGDGHNIVSYGVSLKVGPSSTYGRKIKKAQMDKAMNASRKALSEAKAQNKWLSAEAAYYGDSNRELPRRFRMAKLIGERLMHGEKIDKEIILEYADELKYIRAHGGLK